ncbi:hypothetical protein ACH5RR_041704 [Cinchona calisaya]|uniref:Uncharacterized protein n=1 Tax=Cinchona calisaya TaxID=153742 RepID=A0ABD2XUB5_9GENT
MEKLVEYKENQIKIAKTESELAANANPRIQVEQKDNKMKITKKESGLVTSANPFIRVDKEMKITKKESGLAANAKVQVKVEQKENETKFEKKESELVANTNPPIWDCGSSLYDSFELKSFERQLDSAIHSRTLSMPHLSDRRVLGQNHPPSSQSPQQMSKKSSRIARSFHKLIRSVFKPKGQNGNNNNNSSPFFPAKDQSRQDGFYVVYEKSGVLSTIPEVPELDGLSPEIKSLVRRTASDRFNFTSIGISCA